MTSPLLLKALSIPTIAVLTTLSFWVPFFETNDDIAYMLLLEGKAISNTPEPHIYFINYLLTYPIASLYEFMPNIPWYGLLHISGLLVSLIAILYALLSACQSEPGKEAIVIFLFLFFYFTFALPLIIELQFTKTAFFMAQGGFLLLVSPPNNRENGGGPPSIIYVVSLCLLFLSFLLRMESFLLAATVMTPLLISHAYRHRSSKAYWSFWLGLVLTFSGATLVHYNAFNNDPQWKKLPEINELKSHITDQKTVRFTPQTIPYFAAAGWSKNDYYMIRYFAYSNPEIFSLERFRSVIEESPTQVKPHSFIQKIINEWRWIFTDNNDRQLLMLQLLLTIGGICLLYPLNRKNFLLLIGTVLSTACVLIILSALYKINYRIYMPTVAYLGWLSLFLASRDQGKSKLYANYKKYTGMAFIVGALLILVSTNSTMRSTLAKSKENETKNSQFKSSLLKLAPEQHQLFVVWNTTFPFEAILPIEKHDYLNNFNVLSLGTYNQTPVQKRMLSPFNTNDPFFALASNSDVKLNFSPVFFPQLKTYLSQHYNISIELRSFYSDSNFTFYSGHSRKIKGASLP